MSDRRYEVPHTQMLSAVEYPLRAEAKGATHPLFVEGDNRGQSSGGWMRLQRGASGPVAAGWTGPVEGGGITMSGGPTGATGIYVIRTKDPFPGFVGLDVSLLFTGANGTLGYELLTPKQESDGSWSIPFRVFNVTTGTATDLASGAQFTALLVLRNSHQEP